jgi:hypothetical protein
MKIIRLVSDVLTKSIFQKSSSAPIIIKPNSSIALKSLSFELKHDLDFVIDSDDYIMSLSITYTSRVIRTYNILVPRGKYNRLSFLNYLTYRINSYLASSNFNEQGIEWKFTIDNNDRLNITFGVSEFGSPTNFNTLNMTVNSNIFTKTVLSSNIDAWAQCKSFICRGGFSIAGGVGGNNTINNEFYYGLCNQIFSPSAKTTLSLDDFTTCVFTIPTNKHYRIKTINGDIIETNTDYMATDIIYIRKIRDIDAPQCKLVYAISRNNATITLGQTDPTENFTLSTLFTTIALGLVEEGFAFGSANQYLSPFCASTVDGKYTELETLENIYTDDNLTAPSPFTGSITFETLTMQTFMGYDQKVINIGGVSGTYKANNIFGLPLTFQAGDDLVVELQNLNIDGYDFLENKKASIVAVIPIESLTQNVYSCSYIEPFPTFLSLNNDQLTNINTFYVSIKSGGQLLDVSDKIFIQLLING